MVYRREIRLVKSQAGVFLGVDLGISCLKQQQQQKKAYNFSRKNNLCSKVLKCSCYNDVRDADLAVSRTSPGQLLKFASHATFSLVLYRGIYNSVLKCTTVQMAAQ